jgi:hypothetical protein
MTTAQESSDNPVVYIRRDLFGCASQDYFAILLGTTQATVSRWERWRRVPGHRQEQVRAAARERGLAWDDRFFFEVPSAAAAPVRPLAGVVA